MPLLNTVPQPEFFFHQFPVDLNTTGSPAQHDLASIPTGGDNTGPSGYQTFASIDAFGASSQINSTVVAQNDNYVAENTPATMGAAEVLNLDHGRVGFENGNPISQHVHAHHSGPDSVPMGTNQADTALPSQFQPFDAINLNIYDQSWPSTSSGTGYVQNNRIQSTTLPSDNHRGHGNDGPVAPNGHHDSAQTGVIFPFEEQRVLCPSALVVIPGAPAFSIPLDVANLLLTMSRRQ